MFNRRIVYLFLAGLLALVLILGWMIYVSYQPQALQVVFLDVGQGDAILIQQGRSQLLIDGGRSGKQLLEEVGKHVPFWDRRIEAVVATHPDQDHIGGLVDLFAVYEVGSIIRTQDTSDSQTFKAFVDAAQSAEKVEAVRGVKIDFPAGAEAEVLYPIEPIGESNKNDSNDNSVVLKLVWGDNTFLFTGDLPSASENKLMDGSVNIQADVLKVSHHGSRYATGEEFLSNVSPEEAVISVGKGNMYGHPNIETIERLNNHGVRIWRTDEAGDILFDCKRQNEKCQIVSN